MNNIINIPYRNKFDSLRETTIISINKKSEIYRFPVFLNDDVKASGGIESCCMYSDISSLGRIISANTIGIEVNFYSDPNMFLTDESCIDIISYTGIYNTESSCWKHQKPLWFAGIIYNTKEL